MMYLSTTLFLTIPLIFSGILHMFSVRYNLFSFLAKPISTSMFGQNKTWRGLVLMALYTIPGVFLAQWLEKFYNKSLLISLEGISPVLFGAVLGLSFMISELPNSFVKRKLGVKPGMLPEKKRILFFLIDQTDSILGCSIVYYFRLNVPWQSLVMIFILGPALHFIINLVLYLLGVRKRPV